GDVRAFAANRLTTHGYQCSTSPTFLRRNQNQPPEENFETLKKISQRANAADVDLVVYISMAFGNPYGDRWNEIELAEIVSRLDALGIRSISLADTVGIADAKPIEKIVTAALKAQPDCEIGV